MKVPLYILLGNFTAEGLRKLENFPKRDKTARHLIEKEKGELQIYYTLGEYDFVAVVNMPNEDSMLRLLLRMGKIGDVSIKSMKAWSESDFHRLVTEL